jgi:hypothetical protein
MIAGEAMWLGPVGTHIVTGLATGKAEHVFLMDAALGRLTDVAHSAAE